MLNNERKSYKNLLTCFFEESENSFGFLEAEHSFLSLSGLSEYKSGRQIIRSYTPQKPFPEHFWATARYETKNITIEINYKEEDFSLECLLYFNQIHRMQLHDFLNAAKKRPLFKTDLTLAQSKRLAKEIWLIGKTIQKYKDIILDPPPKIMEKAITMRESRLENLIRKHFKKDLQLATILAAKAFKEEDFAKVVMILTPYESYLSTTDLKKLEKARKHLGRIVN